MPFKTYQSLPVEILYKLLTSAVRDLFAASDVTPNDPARFNAMRKQVEMLLDLIEEKEKLNNR
jgi:hypothetical protein